MSIDQKVLAAIQEYNDAWDLSEDGTVHQLLPLSQWTLRTTIERRLLGEDETPVISRVHRLIRQAPMAECLSSPYEYIREYKQWCSKE